MIALTIIAIILFLVCYSDLGYLTNIGFHSYLDGVLYRTPFKETEGIRKILVDSMIKDGLFGELHTEGKHVTKLVYSPFWVAINRWLMAALLIIVGFIIINMILTAKEKMPKYIGNIHLYLCAILAIAGYYLTVIYCGRYEIVDGTHGRYIMAAGFAAFMIILGIVVHCLTYKKERGYNDYLLAQAGITEGEIEAKHKKNAVFVGFVMFAEVLIVALTLIMWYKPYSIAENYAVNYGVYETEEHPLRVDLEEGFNGNYMNQAVDTEKGLFYLAAPTKSDMYGNAVMKLDDRGMISEVYPGDPKPEKDKNEKIAHTEFFTISYSDGYLYLCRSNEMVRMNPDDGSTEVVMTASENYDFTDGFAVDNKLYCLEEEQFIKLGVDLELPDRVWVADISGETVSEPQIYMYHPIIDYYQNDFTSNYNSDLLTMIVSGEDTENPTKWYDCYRHQTYNGFDYGLYVGNRSGYRDKDGSRDAALLFGDAAEDGERKIEQVVGLTGYKGKVYYVQLKEHGFDVCKCNPDGTGIEVIDTYETDENTWGGHPVYSRIMIGQGKLMVYAKGDIYLDYYPDGTYMTSKDGTIIYTTDLK